MYTNILLTLSRLSSKIPAMPFLSPSRIGTEFGPKIFYFKMAFITLRKLFFQKFFITILLSIVLLFLNHL